MTFQPAPQYHGVLFRRIDLPGKPIVRACGKNVFDTSRGTSIRDGEAEVRTIEHLMAALAGLEIDNVMVDIDAEETPILDGSSRLYVEALQQIEKVEQTAERDFFTVNETVEFSVPEKGIQIRIEPANDFQMVVDVDYGTEILAKQTAELKNIRDFVPEVYSCRTFVFLHELQFLIQNNLAHGGDLDNAIVFVAQMPSPEALAQLGEFFHKRDLKVTENGILNNIDLRFPNEPARHKLLDLVGDLYLLGKPIKGHIFATRPGHFANTELVKKLVANRG